MSSTQPSQGSSWVFRHLGHRVRISFGGDEAPIVGDFEAVFNDDRRYVLVLQQQQQGQHEGREYIVNLHNVTSLEALERPKARTKISEKTRESVFMRLRQVVDAPVVVHWFGGCSNGVLREVAEVPMLALILDADDGKSPVVCVNWMKILYLELRKQVAGAKSEAAEHHADDDEDEGEGPAPVMAGLPLSPTQGGVRALPDGSSEED